MNVHDNSTRTPAVAGQFYPGNAEILRRTVDEFVGTVSQEPVAGRIFGLIVPHAGYRYSGEVAGKAYAALSGQSDRFVRAVVLAPSHTVGMDGVALAPHSGLQTPLGTVDVDRGACSELERVAKGIVVNSAQAHAREHSLEVQLPFLQAVLPQVKLVPAVCGKMGHRRIWQAADAFVSLWDEQTLWVVSSDFTHYGFSFGYVPFRDNVEQGLRELDMGAIEKITELDTKGFFEYVERTGATICGAVPITLFLRVLELSGAQAQARLIKYTTSGALTGDFDHSVSYASILFSED
jgi:AmmeMemoRadiSam system protein B